MDTDVGLRSLSFLMKFSAPAMRPRLPLHLFFLATCLPRGKMQGRRSRYVFAGAAAAAASSLGLVLAVAVLRHRWASGSLLQRGGQLASTWGHGAAHAALGEPHTFEARRGGDLGDEVTDFAYDGLNPLTQAAMADGIGSPQHDDGDMLVPADLVERNGFTYFKQHGPIATTKLRLQDLPGYNDFSAMEKAASAKGKPKPPALEALVAGALGLNARTPKHSLKWKMAQWEKAQKAKATQRQMMKIQTLQDKTSSGETEVVDPSDDSAYDTKLERLGVNVGSKPSEGGLSTHGDDFMPADGLEDPYSMGSTPRRESHGNTLGGDFFGHVGDMPFTKQQIQAQVRMPRRQQALLQALAGTGWAKPALPYEHVPKGSTFAGFHTAENTGLRPGMGLNARVNSYFYPDYARIVSGAWKFRNYDLDASYLVPEVDAFGQFNATGQHMLPTLTPVVGNSQYATPCNDDALECAPGPAAANFSGVGARFLWAGGLRDGGGVSPARLDPIPVSMSPFAFPV